MRLKLPPKVIRIIRVLQENGFEAYAVGGCVRDMILGREPDDWDITTSARPQQVKKIFLRTVDTGLAHGTVTVLLGDDSFEVTTYRIDGAYEDHRHPSFVTFSGELAEDLRRRDFTINAMAYNREQGLVDLFGGMEEKADSLWGRRLGAVRRGCAADPAGGAFFGAAGFFCRSRDGKSPAGDGGQPDFRQRGADTDRADKAFAIQSSRVCSAVV